MNYTDEQVKFLMRFENGGKWSEAAAENLDLLLMLDKDGLLSHHEDTKPDCITLTEKGKQVVFAYRKKLELLKKEARKETEDKEQQAFQNKLSVASILIPLGTFIFGLFLEHFTNIIGGFSIIFEVICDIFH